MIIKLLKQFFKQVQYIVLFLFIFTVLTQKNKEKEIVLIFLAYNKRKIIPRKKK